MTDVFQTRKLSLFGLAVAGALFACGGEPSSADEADNVDALGGGGGVTVSVYASGIDNPRGLKFGPDGKLYVGTAGTGGTTQTIAQCPDLQVVAPFGPYSNGPTGQILRISSNGTKTVVASGFPSAFSPLGNLQSIADVTFVGNQLYALLVGAGCSHGEPNIPNALVRVNTSNGSWTTLNDLGQYLRDNPGELVPGDLEPDGAWYSMVTRGTQIFALEANTGLLERISPISGTITRLIDYSHFYGDNITPTALTVHNGTFFVGNLEHFPIVPGTAVISRAVLDSVPVTTQTGLTAILGLVVDATKFYVLETSVNSPSGFPEEGYGQITRVNRLTGAKTVIVTGLNKPSSMTLGPDGKLYVSDFGYSYPPNQLGRILKISGI